MDTPDLQLQAIVQQLVMEHGEYAPLELLLAANRLGYEDYRGVARGAPRQPWTRSWRAARRKCGRGSKGRSRGPRRSAWTASRWCITAGGENAGAVLKASADPPLDALLGSRFRRTREHDQLDLFIDGAQTAAVNALLEALAARDAGEAGRALERLVRIDRDHGQRFHATALIAALEAPAPEGSERGLERLDRMEREWLPAASALLGARRRDFLAPSWRDIGRALDPAPFDRNRPERHASRAYREGLDWESARRSVLAVPDYERQPVLLARLAEAEWRLRNRVQAVGCWFALCRLAPEAFERLIEAPDFPDWVLRTAWRGALEQDLEPEMTPAWFPAWMLIEEPGLAGVLDPLGSDDDPSRAFDAVIALLAHPEPDERGIGLRRGLQAVHPGLLKRCLAKWA